MDEMNWKRESSREHLLREKINGDLESLFWNILVMNNVEAS